HKKMMGERWKRTHHALPVIFPIPGNYVASGEVECAARADCSDRHAARQRTCLVLPGRISRAPTFTEAKDCFTSSSVVIRLMAPSESTIVMSVFTAGA